MIVALATIVNLSFVNQLSSIPINVSGKRIKLPLVTDRRLLERVGTIATRMGIDTPPVKLLPSAGGEQLMMAFAVMLPAPELVVSDGILHRMHDVEADGIIGHELAHLANRSLWTLAAASLLSTFTVVVASCWMPMTLALPFGFLVMIGLYRIVCRPIEFDCDRRAARVVGHGAVMSALTKVHAVHPLPDKGLLSLLVYSTTTHPSRNARVAALWPDASEDDQRKMPPNNVYVWWETILSSVFLTIWLIAVTTTLAMTAAKMDSDWLVIPLWILAIIPVVILKCAMQRMKSVEIRPKAFKIDSITSRRPLLFVIGILLSLLATFLAGPWVLNHSEQIEWIETAWFIVIGAQILILTAGLGHSIWRARRMSQVRVRVDHAMQLHDFRTVQEICEANPKLLQQSPPLRHNYALAKAAAGDQPQAIEIFSQLLLDHPEYLMAGIALNILLLESNQPEQALHVATQLSQNLQGDPAIVALSIRSLLRLNRIDEADRICRDAICRNPADNRLLAPSAEVAFSLGKLEQAEDLIQRALELTPGFPPFLLTAAKIKVKNGTLEQAQSAVSQVIAAADGNPFLFLQSEIESLKSELEAKAQSSSTPPRAFE